jgi:Transcriptional regulator
MTTQRQAAAALRASARCAQLYLEHGSTQLTAAEIAAGIGVAERTFYRHFPHKRYTIRPLLDESSTIMAASIRESTELGIEQSLVKAFQDAFGGTREELTRRLYPLVFRDAGMWAVLLQAVYDGAAIVRPAIAERLGVLPENVRARTAASIFVAAILMCLEIMVEDGTDPLETFPAALSAATSNPFRPPTKGSAS